ncbi:MAG: hypothetical protein AVDCRST_MAG43-1221 [uncultured Thermomicrobiales bacterium]|uniref:Uncharacterized protein n=1 Tax=uncultured Thermomicrobiales bacterium TaxID=1645740 RepID=A0A6J4UK42_9BACT|nr:MAG: hypothetical protein AVDCRST_MAG43-1221 [uncultured Thermomicrobiales bacterium]
MERMADVAQYLAEDAGQKVVHPAISTLRMRPQRRCLQ